MIPQWGDAAAARLRMLAREAGTQQELSAKTNIPIATLQRILKGNDPGPARLARLADALNTTVEFILRGAGGQSVKMVDVFDLEVAAGHGRKPLDEEPVGQWPLPADWVAQKFGDSAQLKIARVAGDSQEPELNNGDLVIFDTATRGKLREGMHVVRIDDTLLVKRIQLEGRTVRLISANKLYDDIKIDIEADRERFEVIGRAGGAIKVL